VPFEAGGDPDMITAIIQARVSSKRLPNKVFAELNGKPLIWHVVDRVRRSKKIEKTVLAIPDSSMDDVLEQWANNNDVEVFRGSEQDVLSRYFQAALFSGASMIARITADDPFKDPEIIDKVIDLCIEDNLDFACNNNPPSFPEGLDVEIYPMSALERAEKEDIDPFSREHLMYFYKYPEKFKQSNFSYSEDISFLRWTIDYPPDLEMARVVYEHLYSEDGIFLVIRGEDCY
jgi:spore coat polysaccharide biosynthesis protein SpsF